MKMFVWGAITALFAVIFSSWILGDEDLLCTVLQNPDLCGRIPWLQVIAWAAVVIVAIVGVIEIRSRSQQARAAFLLENHVQWQALSDARLTFNALVNEIARPVEKNHSGEGSSALEGFKRDAFEPEINSLYESKSKIKQETYRDLTNLAGFFETMGYMVKRKYIPEGDAINLYMGPILQMGTVLARHIAWRQNKIHTPPGLYENLLYLIERAEIKKSSS